MNFNLLKKKPESDVVVQEPITGGGDNHDPTGCPQGSVFCRHGIHSGWFPIVGMRLGEARPILNQLLNIDPEAVAVINGQIVGDDYVIGEDVELLNFVKKSSIKG
jgi:hypothetical protein